MKKDDTYWETAPLGELVDHILTAHHIHERQELALLSELLTSLMRAHWMKHPEFLRAHTVFHQAKAALEQHFIQEETAGFPLLKAHGEDPSKSLAPFLHTTDMHVEAHANALKLVAEVKSTLWDGKVPEGLGPEASFAVSRLSALLEDLECHVHLENDILFKRAAALAQGA